MSYTLKDFRGNAIYLDTMVFYGLLRGIDPTIRQLFAVVKAGDLQAYTSTLTFDELTYRMIWALAQEKYGDAAKEKWQEHRAEVFSTLYPHILPPLTLLRNFPNLTLLDVSAIDLMLMSENMGRCLLTPRVALHLAAMQKIGCFDVLSHNKAFDCIHEVRRYTLT